MSRGMVDLEHALDIMDNMGDEWRNYQVHYEPKKGRNGWAIETFSIPRVSMERLRLIRDGGLDRDCGWGDGFTKITHNGHVWMSDTRAEVMEHSPLFNKLWWSEPMEHRTLLVNGLGLGMAVHGALFHGVEHVDVVEIDPDVIDLVGPLLDPDRVMIHQGDALTIQWPKGKSWTFAWHDIWPSISEDNIESQDALTRKYRRRVQWQDSWQRKGCLKQRRDSKRFMSALERHDWAEVKRIDPDF